MDFKLPEMSKGTIIPDGVITSLIVLYIQGLL